MMPLPPDCTIRLCLFLATSFINTKELLIISHYIVIHTGVATNFEAYEIPPRNSIFFHQSNASDVLYHPLTLDRRP